MVSWLPHHRDIRRQIGLKTAPELNAVVACNVRLVVDPVNLTAIGVHELTVIA